MEEIQDNLFVDDWDELFDDEAPADEMVMSIDALNFSFDPNDTTTSFDAPDSLGSVAPPSPVRRALSEPVIRQTSSRNAALNTEKPPLPLPSRTKSWHNEAVDRPHRQAMIHEISRLLQLRKQRPPSNEWTQQLPHKARRLEERLYRSASSLESYIDRTTLKIRLKKLARAITKQFLQGKRKKSLIRSRSEPKGSLSSLPDSFSAGTAMPSNSDASLSASDKEHSRNVSFSFSDSDRVLRSIPKEPFSSSPSTSPGRASEPKASTAGDRFKNGQSSQAVSAAAVPSKQQEESNSLSSVGSANVSELERQKAVNARLQKQIMDNIRKQEELVRKLQASAQGRDATALSRGQTETAKSPAVAVKGPTASASLSIQANQLPIPNRPEIMPASNAAVQINPNLLAAQTSLLNGGMTPIAFPSPVVSSPMGTTAAALGQQAFSNSLLGLGNPSLMQQALSQPLSSLSAQQQISLLQQSALLSANTPMMAAAAAAAALQPNPILSAASIAPVAGFNPSMPPPSMAAQRRPSVTTSHQQQVASSSKGDKKKKKKKASAEDDSIARLSPSSFKW